MSHQVVSKDFILKASSSRFNYWAGYAANISLVIWLWTYSFQGHSFVSWLVGFLIGIFLWTLGEYALHRYPYHIIKSPLSVGHGLHHDTPKALLGVPWYLTGVILVGIFFGLSIFFETRWVGLLMGSFWLGYIGYCLMHHSVHHWNFSNPIFKELKRHHLVHHVHGDYNLGITTTFWDKIFKTEWISKDSSQSAQHHG
jgi:4-hydroxysphinganine ceramide fatty acyl 2-hydroxylase